MGTSKRNIKCYIIIIKIPSLYFYHQLILLYHYVAELILLKKDLIDFLNLIEKKRLIIKRKMIATQKIGKKDLVASGEYDSCNFEEELEEDDYYYDDI